MGNKSLISTKPLLPALIKNDSIEAVAVVKYEKVDAIHYSFSYSFDDEFSFRMNETEQSTEQTDFVEAEFEEEVPENYKGYYAVAAASGILTGALSTFQLTEKQLAKISEFKEKDWKPLIVKGANLSGYKKNDYKGAAKFLVTRAVHTIEKNEKAKECLTVLAEHPSLTGLIFSVLTQYYGKIIAIGENGELSIYALPDYYVIGANNAEKMLCAVFYWLLALAADQAMSKRRVLDELRIPIQLIKIIKEFVNLPFMKDLPTDYSAAEKKFSKWLGKMIKGAELYSDNDAEKTSILFSTMKTVLNLADGAFPILINECMVRSMFVLLRVCSIVKEQKVTSVEQLMNIQAKDILDTDERLLSRMCMIASASFVGANIAGAILKASAESKANGKKFSKVFLAELNIAGIGCLLFRCAEDSRFWGEDIRILFQRNKKSTSEEVHNDQNNEGDRAFDPMLLNPVQARILYSLENLAVQYDINRTRKASIADNKRLWLEKWKKLILSGINVDPEQKASYFVEEEGFLYDGIYQLSKDKSQWRWFYLLTQELALFNPYSPLGEYDDRVFKKLRVGADYVRDQFVRRQTIASQDEVDTIVKMYSKYKGYVSGSTQSKIIGAGVATLTTVATGGVALTFAPGIAAAIAGEAVVGLHGAALTSASLAFVGGGSIAAGGLGMAGGTAIITGGGALVGLISSGTASTAAILLQTPSDYWVRQSSKLLTYCNCVLEQNLHDKEAVKTILHKIEATIEDVERELKEIKNEKNDLDKDLIKKTEEYLKYLGKCRSELKRIVK